MQRSLELSRRVATSAMRVSGAMVAPVSGSLAQLGSTARATARLAPTLAMGAYEQLGEHMPRSIAQQLPARTAEVDALEARVARLEAAAPQQAAATKPHAATTAPKARPANAAPKVRAASAAVGRRPAR
jgi:hypothetical protein